MKSERLNLLVLFLLGFGLFMFTRYSTFLPSINAMVLVAPIFILRFIRIQPAKRGILLTLLGFLLAFNISLWGLFEFDNASFEKYFSLIRSSMLAIVWFIPYWVDRLIYPKFQNNKLLSTLTFPIINTVLLFLVTYEGPFDDGAGTTNSFYYSYGSLAFMQVRSLFGIWILIFIHSWLPAIINYFWENNFKWEKVKLLAIIYPALLLGVLIFGLIKTNLNESNKSVTVKTASMVLIPEDGIAKRMSGFFNNKVTSPYEKTISRIENMVNTASTNNARILSFQEYSILINENDEAKLKDTLKMMAAKNEVYLSFTYGVYANEGKGENKQLLISPAGKIELEYVKRFLIGIGSYGETGLFRKGEERIQTLVTPYGKIALSICRDAGFRNYMRQASEMNVDIMLSPSYDWPKSYSAWYISTAVENGFSFIRPTYNGYSYAADFNGEELAYMNSDKTNDGILYADVPTKGTYTLYSSVGDLFAWLNLIAFLGLIFLRFNKRDKATS